jgi:hypothetical protein
MAIISTRSGLSDYCRRSLGEPVIEVNVDDDQIEDRLDEAIQMFQEYHSDAVVRTFRKHAVTSTDISNEYISLPEDMLFVKSVLPISANGYNDFSLEYQLNLNDLYGMRNPGDLVSYELTKQHMRLLDLTINGLSQQVTFNRHMDRLMIEFQWGTDIEEGQYIVVEGYQTLNPETYTDVYNDHWLKRYCTALFKRQWGNNLKKFEGVQMPGGVTLQGQAIFQEAIEEIEKLEEQLRLNWEEPVDFFIG